MGRLKTMGLAVVMVLAIGAISVAPAGAAKANLVLREGGEHPYEGLDPVLATRAPFEVSFETELGGCATTSPVEAEMHENSLPEDTVSSATWSTLSVVTNTKANTTNWASRAGQ